MLFHLKRLLTGSAIYGLGSALNQGLALLLLPLFTAYLSPGDYGTIAALSLWSMLIVMLGSMGTGVSMGLAYYDKQFEPDEVVWNTIFMVGCSAAFLLGLNVLFSGAISQWLFKTPVLAHFIVVYALISVVTIVVSPPTLALQFREKAWPYIVITLVTTFATLSLSILLIVYCQMGVWGRILALFISSSVSLLLFFYFLGCPRGLKINPTVMAFLLQKGLPILPSFAALYVLQQGNVYFISHWSGLGEAGLYSIGYSFGNGMGIIIQAFATAWFPFMMSLKENRAEVAVVAGKICSYYIISMGFVTLLFYVYAKPLILIFTQPNFYRAYSVIGLMASLHFLMGLFNILNIECNIEQEVEYIVAIQIITMVIFVGLVAYLIPLYQAWGGALALVSAYGLMNVLLFIWNWSQKHRYVAIQYERRCLYVLLFYIGFVFFIGQQPDAFSYQWLWINHGVLAGVLAMVYLFLIHPTEKQRLWGYFKKP